MLSSQPLSTFKLQTFQLSSIVHCLSVPSVTAGSLPGPPPSASNESVSALGFHWKVKVTCALDGYPVKKRRIAEGIEYLKNKVSGYPSLGSMESGRYHDRGLVLNSYSDIANGAQKILDKCSPGDKYVTGEAWFYEVDPRQKGGWVVMVGYNRC
ncbi:hypothetical protein QBC32DRAFT_369857 [Pseudoneurospora amorphoporcata]|uniref:Uncharacterized protein n=1 Tax=Pseudoneurospora amorphoporcata TaxID=241081 RepID=A0AAN6P009_9PEZI|nr:hypothetical protein QBC32DRAFT_369857 [Pseudoneurospora amorphoporcata]